MKKDYSNQGVNKKGQNKPKEFKVLFLPNFVVSGFTYVVLIAFSFVLCAPYM